MTLVQTNTPVIEATTPSKIRETEFWIAANVRPEYPAGGRVGVIDFPLSLPIDSPVTISGVVFRVASVGLIISPERALLVYGLK